MNCKPVLSCSDLMKVKPENEKAKLFNCFELHHWHSTVLAPNIIDQSSGSYFLVEIGVQVGSQNGDWIGLNLVVGVHDF